MNAKKPAAGQIRIVRRLGELLPEHSGMRLKRAVTEGQVTVNGAVVDDPGALVGPGDAVLWDPNRKIRRRVETTLEVLHEDDDAIAVVKPAGLLTHPTEAKEKDTLLSRVSAYVARREKGRGYVSVAHRLDKETSGALVFAKSRPGLVALQAQLRAHTMDRRYVAVVEGDLSGDAGVYDRDVVEDRGDRRRGLAKPGQPGQTAVTEWKVLERFGIATLVEARLKTGRTHQIRIHFAGAGHPVVGDPVYRDPKRPPFPLEFARQALHAGTLGWQTPKGERVKVETPPPPDFARLLADLRRGAARKGAAPRPPARPAPPPAPPPAARPAARPAPRPAARGLYSKSAPARRGARKR